MQENVHVDYVLIFRFGAPRQMMDFMRLSSFLSRIWLGSLAEVICCVGSFGMVLLVIHDLPYGLEYLRV